MQDGKRRTHRRRSGGQRSERTRGRLAVGWAAGILLFAVPLVHAGDEAAPHGALAMDVQARRVEELLPADAGKVPPQRIDRVVWASIVPKDNEMTPERVALGRKLYFDTRLSGDGTVACATCHDVSRGFTDQRPVSEGIRDQLGRRNAPTTMNALLMQTQFLDGRAPNLEEQAKLPIVNPIEMGLKDGAAAVAAIQGDPEYQKQFQAAYGRKPNYDDIGRALASFERTLVFLDAPIDDFLTGKPQAIDDQSKLGWVLFNGKARCVSCHAINASNPLGSDNRFHNIGVAARHHDFRDLANKALVALEKEGGLQQIDELALSTDLSELGRFMVTKDRADIGGFKTSQLRNIGLTGPYMHDGSMQTLWDVMDHYNKGGEENPFLDGGIEPLALSESEIDALVAFMFTLTDKRFADSNQAQLDKQRALALKARPFRDEALAMRKVLPFQQSLAAPQAKEN
jgi:cytochrome c peroxidase